MFYIGVDVGGTGLKAGIVNEEGKIIAKASCPTVAENGYESVIADIAKLCETVVAQANLTMKDIKAIGMGVPGIFDPATKHIARCTNLHWFDVPILEEMAKHTDVPVFVDNDATVAGLAESVAGISKGAENSVFITLGTGVGGGVVIGGKVYSGSNGVGSEIGHMIVVAGGEQCTCGNRGCWERYASATAIIREGRKFAEAHPDCAIAKEVGGNLDAITAKTIFDLAKAGDPDALMLFDNYVEFLCVGLVNLINLYDPEIIALGGGVSHAGEFLVNAVREKLADKVFYKSMKYARVELACLGNDAGIIGAAMLGR